MRNRDPRKNKALDLRRIALTDCSRIFKLFHKYHPEVKEREKQIEQEYRARDEWYWHDSEWQVLNSMEYDWATKIAGYWNAIGGSSGSYYREGRRARQKQALRRAFLDDAWDDFFIPRERQEWD